MKKSGRLDFPDNGRKQRAARDERAREPATKISDVFGMLKRDGQKAISVDDMNDAVAEGWASQV